MHDLRPILSKTWLPPTRVGFPDFAPLVKFKTAGVTLDLRTLPTAAATGMEFAGGIVPAGMKYMRYGQIIAKIPAARTFGLYDPDATDGRQALMRGECYIVDQSWIFSPMAGDLEQMGGVFDAGEVCTDRLLLSKGVPSLADGPTRADFEAAFPAVLFR